MKYDDASWHYGGDFPHDLPNEAGGTHIALFLAWCLLNDLAGAYHLEECTEALAKLQSKTITPGEYFFAMCDGKLTDEDLNSSGNLFAQTYLAEDGKYIDDYVDTFDEAETVYHVPDTWSSFEKLSVMISQRYMTWVRNS